MISSELHTPPSLLPFPLTRHHSPWRTALQCRTLRPRLPCQDHRGEQAQRSLTRHALPPPTSSATAEQCRVAPRALVLFSSRGRSSADAKRFEGPKSGIPASVTPLTPRKFAHLFSQETCIPSAELAG
eukprot:scaffold3404_cov118-Pinguiococcus_pyrenoidosus.AAC.1